MTPPDALAEFERLVTDLEYACMGLAVRGTVERAVAARKEQE